MLLKLKKRKNVYVQLNGSFFYLKSLKENKIVFLRNFFLIKLKKKRK